MGESLIMQFLKIGINLKKLTIRRFGKIVLHADVEVQDKTKIFYYNIPEALQLICTMCNSLELTFNEMQSNLSHFTDLVVELSKFIGVKVLSVKNTAIATHNHILQLKISEPTLEPIQIFCSSPYLTINLPQFNEGDLIQYLWKIVRMMYDPHSQNGIPHELIKLRKLKLNISSPTEVVLSQVLDMLVCHSLDYVDKDIIQNVNNPVSKVVFYGVMDSAKRRTNNSRLPLIMKCRVHTLDSTVNIFVIFTIVHTFPELRFVVEHCDKYRTFKAAIKQHYF